MDLDQLRDRIDYERGTAAERDEVVVLGPGGRVYDILSLNRDPDAARWLLVVERAPR